MGIMLVGLAVLLPTFLALVVVRSVTRRSGGVTIGEALAAGIAASVAGIALLTGYMVVNQESAVPWIAGLLFFGGSFLGGSVAALARTVSAR